jgi:hypothetical protein
LCTENEKISEAQLHAKNSISGGGGAGVGSGGGSGGGSRSSKKARTAVTAIALSEEDEALAELGYSAQPQYSTVVSIEAEMKSIVQDENDIDLLPCPLTFYSTGNYGGDNLPILSRIASVIFPCSPASGDVERTNSSTGKVLSPSRQSLLPSIVISIVFLKGVYKEEERRPTHREKVAKKLSEICRFYGKIFLHFPKG